MLCRYSINSEQSGLCQERLIRRSIVCENFIYPSCIHFRLTATASQCVIQQHAREWLYALLQPICTAKGTVTH